MKFNITHLTMFHISNVSLKIYVIVFLILDVFAFTIEELKAVNYEVDILQTPKKKEEQTVPVLHMTSIFGQEYQCMLPQVDDEEVSERVTYNEKNTNIKELLKPMHTGNCLLKAKDWWTYELCFGQYIKQFHIEDGQIIGQVLTLGLYESDYDWSNETDQEKFKHVKQRYHSQFYVNGTKCDLTGQPRVAEIRIFCEEDSGDYIQRVDEPGTCSYVITVHTSRICSHPQLKPLPSKKAHTIPCHPLLNEEQYSHYLKKLNEEKALADQKRSQWLNNQQERLQVMKNENSLNNEKDEVQEFKKLFKNYIDAVDNPETNKELEKLKSFLTPEKSVAVKNTVQEYFDAFSNEAELEDDTELSEDDKNSDYLKKIAATLNMFLQKLDKAGKDAQASEKFHKGKPYITDIANDDSVTEEASISELEIEKKKSIVNEDNGKEKEVKAESLLEEDADNDDLQVRIRRLDRLNSDGKVFEIDRLQQKKLEQAIKEKLEKHGVNTGGRRIEVKIIKAGYYDSHLTDEEANQFENMITALLTGEQEAIQEMERNKKLEENYKFTWKNDNEEMEEVD